MTPVFILLFLTTCFAANMKTYSAGEYIISPFDYGYKLNIIVELWGAGGSVYNQTSNQVNMCAGSGAYIKSSVPTYLSSFKLTVGRAINENTICNGKSSSFTGKSINLTVGGGYGRCGDCQISKKCGYGGDILSMNGTNEILYFTGQDSQASYYSIYSSYVCTGGNAPSGGVGGCRGGVSPSLCRKYNGTQPGGGSGWFSSSYAPFGFAYGGDGAAIMYY